LCETHGVLHTVLDAMEQEFDAAPDRLRSDLLAFVDALTAKGLLAIQ
jgi:hypothetical protein